MNPISYADPAFYKVWYTVATAFLARTSLFDKKGAKEELDAFTNRVGFGAALHSPEKYVTMNRVGLKNGLNRPEKKRVAELLGKAAEHAEYTYRTMYNVW